MTRIEWCDETLNPLGHGCYGPTGTKAEPKPCPYCYAKRFAARGMSGCSLCKAFIPHPHFEKLAQLKAWKKSRNIFMQSMGDLFHPENPPEWIAPVMEACIEARHHNYLFLTKCPERYLSLFDGEEAGLLPGGPNFWYGTTVNNSGDFIVPCRAETLAKLGKHRNKFLSIEPLFGEIHGIALKNLRRFQWIIVGAMTGPGAAARRPERSWVEAIVYECWEAKVPVFLKDNLREVMDGDLVQEFPEGLREVAEVNRR